MPDAKYFPEWQNMTVREIRASIAERPSIVFPLAVIEQHGYHLPTCTDAMIAEQLSLRVGRKIGMLVAPTINMSFSGGELPGTININPNIMGLLVGEALRSLVAQGLRNIFIVLGHGGSENARSLDNTLKLLLRSDPGFRNVMLVLAPAWRFAPSFRECLDQNDWHAAWAETSVMMALAPELVQMDKLEMDEDHVAEEMRKHPDLYQRAEKPVEHEFVVPRMTQRPDVRVGVMGYPERATVEFGRKIVGEAVSGMAELFTRLEADRAEEYYEVAWTPDPIIM